MEFDYRWEALKNLVIDGEQLIYVTYNIKDFEDINRTDRSTRNLESRININYRPGRKWDIQTTFYRKETHVSYIDWAQFAETTLDTIITYIATHKHEIQLKSPWKNSRLFVDLGYRHFQQSRLFNTSMTSLENLLVPINLKIRNYQTGPQTGIRLVNRSPATLDLSIWWQMQILDFQYREIENFTSISANYKEETLQKQTRIFRPFVKLRMNFGWGKGRQGCRNCRDP